MYMTDSCSLFLNKGKNVLKCLCYDDDNNDINDVDNNANNKQN